MLKFLVTNLVPLLVSAVIVRVLWTASLVRCTSRFVPLLREKKEEEVRM
jgi:hypothetical protein